MSIYLAIFSWEFSRMWYFFFVNFISVCFLKFIWRFIWMILSIDFNWFFFLTKIHHFFLLIFIYMLIWCGCHCVHLCVNQFLTSNLIESLSKISPWNCYDLIRIIFIWWRFIAEQPIVKYLHQSRLFIYFWSI